MTERQKTMVWKRTQAHRDRFGKSQTREWYVALFKQLQPVLDEISPENLDGLEARIPQLMTDEAIQEQLVRTMEVVGVYFAKDTFKSVEKAMGDNWTRKEGTIPTDENWISMIMALLGEKAGERITAIVDESRAQAIDIVKATLIQAAEEGLGTSQMSVLLRDNMIEKWGEISTYRAARIARTETTMASNLGSLTGAKEAGVALQKVWLSTRDSRTRRRRDKGKYDHYGKFPSGPDGEKRELDEKFTKTGESLEYPGDYAGSAGNVINCYTGDMTIKSPIVGAQRSNYSGKMIEIITRGGKRLTVTPNHSILTDKGFIKANALNNGYQLICDGEDINSANVINSKNIYNEITFARDIFNTLNTLFRSQELSIGHLDFDGDARFMDGNVNIINTNIKLPVNSKILINDICDFRLKQSRAQTILIERFCRKHLGFNTFFTATNSIMRFLYLRFSSLFGHLTPFQFFGIGLSPYHYSMFSKMPTESDAWDAAILREFIKTHSRFIHFDEIIKVRDYEFSGHVYDFTSLSGVNIANNIYTSNCRCSMYYEPKEMDEV